MTPDQIAFLHAVAPLAMGYEFAASELAEAAGITRAKAGRVAAQLTNGSNTFIGRTWGVPSFYKSISFETHYQVFCSVTLKMKPANAWDTWNNAVGDIGISFLVTGRYIAAAIQAAKAHPDRIIDISLLPSQEARVFVQSKESELSPQVTFTRSLHLIGHAYWLADSEAVAH